MNLYFKYWLFEYSFLRSKDQGIFLETCLVKLALRIQIALIGLAVGGTLLLLWGKL